MVSWKRWLMRGGVAEFVPASRYCTGPYTFLLGNVMELQMCVEADIGVWKRLQCERWYALLAYMTPRGEGLPEMQVQHIGAGAAPGLAKRLARGFLRA